jgi:hypothetical protein
MSKRTRAEWVKLQAARQKEQSLMTEEQFIAEQARDKQLRAVGRSANKAVIALEIMAALAEFQARSGKEHCTLLVISPNTGEKQTVLVIEESADTNEQCEKLARYYTAVFAEEERQKAEPIPGFSLKRVPKAKYRLDIFMSGKDLHLAETEFGELSRKTLPYLPSLVRMAERMSASLRTPDGIEVLNPKHNPKIKEYVKQAIAAATSEAIVVPPVVLQPEPVVVTAEKAV